MNDLIKKAEEYAAETKIPASLYWTARNAYLAGAREALGMASQHLRDTNVHLAATRLLHSNETTPEQDKCFEALGEALNDAADSIDALKSRQSKGE